MEIVIASDHAAFNEKQKLIEKILGPYPVDDMGTSSHQSCDYPDFAIKACREIQKRGDTCRGILLCGSGIGMSIVANKFEGIRAALCRTKEDAKLSRQHNNANVLCLGSRTNTFEELVDIIKVWLHEDFEGFRHMDRLNKFKNIGE